MLKFSLIEQIKNNFNSMRENKKGNILKKKVGLIGKVSLMIALLFTAISFSFLRNNKKVEAPKTQAYTWEEGVGLVDDSNIVLSVKKVAINSEGATKEFDEDKKVACSNPDTYYYRDIPDVSNDYHKTLVSDKGFIKLNNRLSEGKYVANDSNYEYVKANGVTSENFSSKTYYHIVQSDNGNRIEEAETFDAKEEYYELKEIDNSNKMQEAVLITFGQEAYKDGKIYYPGHALTVEIYHNSPDEKMNNVPASRSEGLFKKDFGFIIPQSEDNEGYYKIIVKSDYFNQQGNQAKEDLVFEFYIINDDTYTGVYKDDGKEYSAKPSLRLADNSQLTTVAGTYIYNQGSTSKEFPVLNYDYTLYKMTYTHTLDGATAEYEYNYLPDAKQIQIIKTYKNKTTELNPILLNQNDYSNILVLLFSELGDYQFDFEYIYSGYPYNQPSSVDKYKVIDNINESLSSIKLEINGFEANFSKKNYFDGAEMRYFTFANSDKVYFKVVDGYKKENEPPTGVDSLGIMYTYDTRNDSLRTGRVAKAQDINVLTQLDSAVKYETLYKKILDNSATDLVDSVLNDLIYETTDQNPIKLKGNTNFVACHTVGSKITYNSSDFTEQGSFYIYSANEKVSTSSIFNSDNSIDDTQFDKVTNPDKDNLNLYYEKDNDVEYIKTTDKTIVERKTYYTLDKAYVAKYTSDTSFNNVGYYLIFLAVADDNKNFSHYQIIAFNNVLQDVNMETIEYKEDSDSLGKSNPDFSKNYIKLSWEEPDIFEMGLTIKYYYRKYGESFTGVYTEEDLKNGTAVVVSGTKDDEKTVVKSCILGNEIGSQESGKYLVVISNEKGNEWTTSFTIDRQDITGISGYGVFGNNNNFSLSTNAIQGFISNSVTGSYGATLSWNDKPSGAKITATYQTISFVENSDEIIEIVDGKINTNYKTNNVLDGKYDIYKPIDDVVDEDNVLYAQGIYIFNLVDEAGNEAKYLLILDNTKTYFKVTKTDKSNSSETVYKTAEWLQYNDVRLDVEIPKYKLIELDDSTMGFIKDYINNEVLNSLFAQNGYIQVRQNQIAEYDSNGRNIHTLNSINDVGTNMPLYIMDQTEDTIRVYDYDGTETDYGTSVIRTYYVKGENEKYIDSNDNTAKSNSYIKVEINPDNSKGYIFFSNSQLTSYPANIENNRLITTKNLTSAHMTNDNFVLFTWIMDIGGKYEVKKVVYEYYPLNLSQYNSEGLYFFDGSVNSKIEKTIYKTGDLIQTVEETVDGKTITRGFVTLNVENNMSQPGYYVVTRTYADSVDLDGTNDTMDMKYHFIVDRNGIISKVDGQNVGDNIHIGLLEDEKKFNTFTQYTSSTPKELFWGGKKIADYNPSLQTNKLPAVLNIPIGKYNNTDGKYSGYYAGKLDFEMYFVDTENQLGKGVGETYPLYVQNNSTSEDDTTIDGITYYQLNIKQYINALANREDLWNGTRNFFAHSDMGEDWLCLPGDYVIIIKDRAEGISKPNSKTIAFTISQVIPETPVYVTPDENYFTDNLSDTTVISSQQWIKIDFPIYSEDNTNAQIDSIEYLDQTLIEGEHDSYILIRNETKGIYTVLVNTMKDADNIYAGEKEYKFTIRYKLGDGQKYKSAYYAYKNGVVTGYYENTYTVVIDRTAPTKNVENLIAQDNLAEYYGGNEIFEQACYDNTNTKTTSYFVNRYTNYYANGGQSNSNIFPFVVGPDTDLVLDDDVVEVRYKEFDISTGSLTLPATNLNGYFVAEDNTKYSNFLSTDEDGYYEILEIDKAGNTTQYVVLYQTSDDLEKLKITFEAILIGGKEELTISIKNDDVYITQSSDGENKGQITLLSFSDSEPSIETQSDKMFVMEIFKQGRKIHTELSTLTTNNMDNVFINILKENGYGNYQIKIHSRDRVDEDGITINYVEKVVNFDISKIFVKDGSNCYLDLDGANFYEYDINTWYFIDTIKYKKIGDTDFKAFTYNNGEYEDESGLEVEDNEIKNLSGDYILWTEDMYGIKRVYSFSTDKDVTEKIEGIFYEKGDAYYSFQPIDIKYVDGLYTKSIQYTFDGETKISTEDQALYTSEKVLFDANQTDANGYRILRLYPFYPSETNKDGKLVQIKVTLTANIEGEKQEIIYNIYLDTRVGVVRLTNTRNGLDQLIDIYNNTQNKSEWQNTNMTSGVMNLSWLNNPSQNLKLEYLLHEKINDSDNGWIDPIDLTNVEDNRYLIQTKEENKGLYAFEVKVYSPDGSIYLGNKVYVFMVKEDTSALFTVQSSTKEYNPNSTLKVSDIEVYPEGLEVGVLPTEMPLYISNEELSVLTNEGVNCISYQVPGLPDGYSLTIYKIYVSKHVQYLATFKVPVTNELIDLTTLKVNGNEISKEPVLSEEIDDVIDLQFTQKLNTEYNLEKKNLLRMEVYFNGEKVEDHFASNKDVYYEIKGAGLYTFKIYDLAGNCQIFENEMDSFDIYALTNKEVALLMNGKGVIENGYFSQAVQIAIVKDGLYDRIEVSATRNGESYSYSKNKQVYTFDDAGTYRVRINAQYGEKTLTKTLIFTIIDPEETANSINLNLLEKYELIKVLNNGEDVTEIFKSLFGNSSKGNFVTYEDLKNEVDDGVFSGKQNFVLTYLVSDGIYPDREQTFSFTLSNEIPAIKCSLKPGESSNKKFTITFNPGLIYEQIGKAQIYINDMVIYIDSNSPIEIKTLDITEKEYGPGSYTIRLVNGENILFSQTVTLKEPINTSGIIIIVVVSAVAIAGVVTFILLRRKMRIR